MEDKRVSHLPVMIYLPSVSLLFIDEDAIAALNEQFLGKSGPTDVLSFPIEDDPGPTGRSPDLGGSGPGTSAEEGALTLLGDVVICPAVAAGSGPMSWDFSHALASGGAGSSRRRPRPKRVKAMAALVSMHIF